MNLNTDIYLKTFVKNASMGLTRCRSAASNSVAIL